jgi:hypothetical protein
VAVRIDISIQPVWTIVRQIRQEVDRGLTKYTHDVRAAAVMTASELVENAVKYGEAVPRAERISFALVACDDAVRIEVANGTTNTAAVAQLRARIDAVARTENRTQLYLGRLEQLLVSPSESGGLGLYRIAFEGAFDLSCSYEEQVMTVTAVRRVS